MNCEMWAVTAELQISVHRTLAPAVERPELQLAQHDQRLSVADKSYVIDLHCCNAHTDTAQSDYVSQCQVSRMCAVLHSINLSFRVSDKIPMTENVNNHTYGGRWKFVVRGLPDYLVSAQCHPPTCACRSPIKSYCQASYPQASIYWLT